jgi:hypothetical protein
LRHGCRQPTRGQPDGVKHPPVPDDRLGLGLRVALPTCGGRPRIIPLCVSSIGLP